MNSARLIVPLLALLAAFLVPGESSAQDRTKLIEALQSSPSPANSVAYLHAPSLRALMNDAEMESLLSDQVEEVWQIAHIDPFTMQPRWEAGRAVLKSSVNAEALAEALEGYVDEIGGTQVVWTPRQSYLIPNGQTVGFLRPADRTMLSTWITDSSRREAPEFLVSQAEQNEQYLSFMLAMNLENSLSPVALSKRLGQLNALKGRDLATIAETLASTKGLSIIIGRKSLQQCILALEFAKSPAALQPFAKEMLNEILNRSGMAAPEVLDWNVKVDGMKLVFQGAISEASLDGLVSILSIQGQAEQTAQAVQSLDKTKQGERGSTPYETKAYFDKVVKLIERNEKYHAQTTGYRAKWNDNNAKRIDELPTLGVDKEMTEYGAQVASMLRANSAAIRGVNVATGQTQAAQSLQGGYYYGGGGGYYGGGYGTVAGYYDPNSTSDYQMVAGSQASMAGFGSFKNTQTQIDQLTGDIRRKMTEKYGTQF